MIHLAICDDEIQYLEQAKSLLQDAAEKLGMEAEILTLDSLDSLLQTAGNHEIRIDMLFLDIEFGEENCFAAAEKFAKLRPRCHIVFLTNYVSYALDSYDIPHIYYVIKDEFEDRMEKIFRAFFSREEDSRIAVKNGTGSELFDLREIYAIERLRRGSLVMTEKAVLKTTTLFEELCQKIRVPFLIRCHNSFLVNLQHVKQHRSNCFVLSDGKEIPISRQYQKTVKEQMRTWQEVWI